MYFMVQGRRFSYDDREQAWEYAIQQAVKRKCYVWVKLCSEAKPFGFNSAVASPEGGLQTG